MQTATGRDKVIAVSRENPHMRTALALMVAAGLVAVPVAANDSMAELKTGGLAYVRSDVVTMEREDLFISLDRVTVDYVFRNVSEDDVDTIVAFPMPDITGSPYVAVPVPDEDSDNFLGFTVSVEGRQVRPALEQRAVAFGIDVTADLLEYDIPLTPLASSTYEALAELPEEVLADWQARGIIVYDIYDVGAGMEAHPSPVWTLQSTFWWRMTFPASARTRVSHQYAPSVGGTAGLAFLSWDGSKSDLYNDYAERYCMDAAFVRAVERRVASAGQNSAPLFESRISYILTTAQNWYGPIGTFHLTIDKGRSENLVSFCGQGVTKTGPTTFELTAKDYYPERDLDVLILQAGQ